MNSNSQAKRMGNDIRAALGRGALLLLMICGLGGCGKPADSTAARVDRPVENSSAEQPTAGDILSQMAVMYQEADSYLDNAQYHERFVRRDDGVEHDVPPHVTSVVFQRPSKIRLSRQVPQMDAAGLTAVLVSNGSRVRSYVSDYTRQILELPTPAEFTVESLLAGEALRAALLPVPVENLFPQLDLLLADEDHPARIVNIGPAERLADEDLAGTQCFRIRLTHPRDGPRVLWIDRNSFLLKRMEMPTKAIREIMDQENVLSELALWIDFHDATIDPPVDMNVFEMEVPAEAIRVREFIPPPLPPGPLLGKVLDDLAFVDLGGNDVTRETLDDKVLVLDFWFTGSAPCQKNVPTLEQLYRQYKDVADFAMYAVSVDSSRVPAEIIRQTLRQWGGTMPVLRDARDVATGQLKIDHWPTTVLLGPGGKIHRISRAAKSSYDDWQAAIDRLLTGEDVAAAAKADYQQELAEHEAALAAVTLDTGKTKSVPSAPRTADSPVAADPEAN